MNSEQVFFQLPCLTEESRTLSGKTILKKWFKHGDSRYLERLLFDFIEINKISFDFLGVVPQLHGSGKDIFLTFRSDKFIGAIPIKSADTGKQIGDFLVTPRFINNSGFNYIDLLYLLGGEIEPEFCESLPLVSSNQLKPPIYYDCLLFIDQFISLLSNHWCKFISQTKQENYPRPQVDWNKYIDREWDPFCRLKFPCKINSLSIMHDDFKRLVYVYKIARDSINSFETPTRIRKQAENKIIYIDKVIGNVEPKEVDFINTGVSDPNIVRLVKSQANKILQFNQRTNKSWRVDFSIVFEKYVQLIFQRTANEIGGYIRNNPHFVRKAKRPPAWSLEFLEPDLLFIKNKNTIVIDSKYKSNYYNLFDISSILKDEHRNDLHQIISYCAFEDNFSKTGFLCYPSSTFDNKLISYQNPINNVIVKIGLIGIPLDISFLSTTIKQLSLIISGNLGLSI